MIIRDEPATKELTHPTDIGGLGKGQSRNRLGQSDFPQNRLISPPSYNVTFAKKVSKNGDNFSIATLLPEKTWHLELHRRWA